MAKRSVALPAFLNSLLDSIGGRLAEEPAAAPLRDFLGPEFMAAEPGLEPEPEQKQLQPEPEPQQHELQQQQHSEARAQSEDLQQQHTAEPAGPKGGSAKRCMQCDKKFNLRSRPHQCEGCQQTFCSNCSDSNVIILSSAIKKPQRVCDKCYAAELDTLNGESSQHLELWV